MSTDQVSEKNGPGSSVNLDESQVPVPAGAGASVAPKGPNRQRINPWRKFIGSMVPNWLLCRPEVSPGAKLCYSRLCQYSGKRGLCYPGQETLASELGVSARQIRTYLKELQNHELIEVQRNGLQKTNDYHFLVHQWMGVSASDLDGNAPSVQERRDFAAPHNNEENQKEGESKKRYTRRDAIPLEEDEAVAQAAKVGVPAEFAYQVYIQLKGVGWVDGAHRQVKSWPDYVKGRWEKARSGLGTKRSNSQRKSQILYELKTQLEAVDARIKEHPCRSDEHNYNESPERRQELRLLRGQRSGLLKKISQVS
jgi:hypothetical protein